MKYNIKMIEIYPRVFHLTFESQYLLTSTCCRLQEFYESPFSNIRGKVFSMDEYMDTYAEETGNFTYFSDWIGFNVPSDIVGKFYKKYKYILTNKERCLFELLLPIIEENKKFYIIGTTEDAELETTSHETAHALYHLSNEYFDKCNVLANKLPVRHKKRIYESLIDSGYHDAVLVDELQAWLSTSTTDELVDQFFDPDETKLKLNPLMSHVEKFRKLFKETIEQQDESIKYDNGTI